MTKKMKKNSVAEVGSTVETIGDDSKYRVCIDMSATGNAEGGKFVVLKGLKESVESRELSGVDKVVGFVYDGTDRLEILTQNIENNGDIQSTIEEARKVD